ncbi:MAG: phosphoenolpyruvate synthase [Candidatus Sericytochromatia bacterium]|nr:phosphoenolpyruvate synthase [Candidatus Tanganyikabacteria bacterium]
MARYVLEFHEIGLADVAVVGGKGAHLGELSRIEGLRVPAGFCVTTDAFRRVWTEASLADGLDRLAGLKPADREAIRTVSAEIRQILEAAAIPDDVAEAIAGQVARLGEQAAFAVRSSATAEDLPTASFAGQHDTYLDVAGPAAILQHIRRCWASLFTERAVTYRLQNGIDGRQVQMAVVVQRMVFPRAAGVMFTADPVTSSRKVVSIEATCGLGDALVSGLQNADGYKVRAGEIVGRTIARKHLAAHAAPAAGTRERSIEPELQDQPALSDPQVLRLAELGRRIEAHFGSPQDVEWCLEGDEFQIVQSRPITALFPVPEADDGENHVYISVGHQQMMTDPMKPLGLSIWQLTTPRPMVVAGGRLFVDVARDLASPATRAGLLEVAGRSDPLIRDALQTVLDRGDFIRLLPDDLPGAPPVGGAPAGAAQARIEPDPAIVAELIARSETSIADMRREIRTRSGPALLDFILADIGELRRILFDPGSIQAIMAGMSATWWLNEKLMAWLGEKNAADTLSQSVPHNVTSEMGLALLDVADAIRPHPGVVAFLQDGAGEGFLDELPGLPGGKETRDAIQGWLARYGMRCAGEIDITRPRWAERPDALVPILLGDIEHFEPGAGKRRFEQGRQEARDKERELLGRLRALPDGEEKAEEAGRMIERLRTFSGYREYPKYGMVSRYFVYKQALLEEAERLVAARVVREIEDIFYLTIQEIQDVVATKTVDDRLIASRKDAFRSYQALTPPRVLTSDGETLAGAYRRGDLPEGALPGLPVSAGTVEGRARVVLEMAEARLEPGDILVTAYTDPSWTPVFVAIEGLVTEVGGLMTHGAVIAREYGVPAVVGVEHATRRIRDGQRIRVHGTDGYVEILH